MTTRAEQLALCLNVNGIDWKNAHHIAVMTILEAALRAVERETWEEAAVLAMNEEEPDVNPPKLIAKELSLLGFVETARAAVRATKKSIAARCRQQASKHE